MLPTSSMSVVRKQRWHVGEAAAPAAPRGQEIGLERLHPRRRQQDRGIVAEGNQRGRGDDHVPSLLEEGEVGLADLGGLHQRESKDEARSLRRPAAMVPWPTTAHRRAARRWPGAAPRSRLAELESERGVVASRGLLRSTTGERARAIAQPHRVDTRPTRGSRIGVANGAPCRARCSLRGRRRCSRRRRWRAHRAAQPPRPRSRGAGRP